LFGYVASYVVVPILMLCTMAVLFARRDAFGRYATVVAGAAIPCLVCLPWMLRFPLPFRDVVAHYAVLDGQASSHSGYVDLVSGFAASGRAGIGSLYASFWKPEFLFIGGPERLRATQLVGVFLVGVAGPLLVGLVYAVRRHSLDDLLILVP